MSKPKVVFIAGERQHAGKTVTSLGLISELCRYIDPSEIGYFKPVGQEMVTLPNGKRIDKDVRIVQAFTELDMPDLEVCSPVRVVDGVTKAYIASENSGALTRSYEAAVAKTMDYFSDKKLVIAEGTGHPGVGSVIGMSNARVANHLDAQILYLVGGGVGRTMDELEVDLSYFKYHGSRVAGVLFNKVLPKKLEGMREIITEKTLARYFSAWDPALKIFGYLPIVKYLNNPSMQSIQQSFKNYRTLSGGSDDAWHLPCRKVKIISQGRDVFDPSIHIRPRDIAVLSADSKNRLRRLIDFNDQLQGEKLGGIILTCASVGNPEEEMIDLLGQSGIPTLAVSQDTADTDMVLYKCFSNAKIQLYDRLKHEHITDLFKNHFETSSFLQSIGI